MKKTLLLLENKFTYNKNWMVINPEFINLDLKSQKKIKADNWEICSFSEAVYDIIEIKKIEVENNHLFIQMTDEKEKKYMAHFKKILYNNYTYYTCIKLLDKNSNNPRLKLINIGQDIIKSFNYLPDNIYINIFIKNKKSNLIDKLKEELA